MNIYAKMLFVYVITAWILVGVTFIYPQKVPSTEGVDIYARGLPLPFYYSGTSIFTGPLKSEMAIGFLLLDLLVWFAAIVIVHFLYRNLVRAGS